jgi:multiple sugar transport system substrate-binding protein
MLNRKSGITVVLSFILLAALLSGCVFGDLSATESRIVVLWHTFTGAEADALQVLTDSFNAENTGNIVLIVEYQRNIIEKLASTSPEHHPDMIVVWPEDVPVYMQQGLTSTSEAFAALLQEEWADLLPMALSLYTVNGQIQALPLGLATYLLYYNVDWLGDLGYTANTSTWEELRRMACAATDPVSGQMGIGVPAQASILLALLTSGGSTIVDSNGMYQFSDDAGIASVSMLNEILGNICGFVYDERDVGLRNISSGALAMIIESSLRLPQVEQAVVNGRNFSLNATLLPGVGLPKHTLWYGPGLMLTTSEPARHEAALNVIAWFLEPDIQVAWGEMTEYLPVRRSLLEAQRQVIADNAVRAQLLDIALQSADSGAWVAWPRYANTMTCRAALLRTLLALGADPMPEASIKAVETACNAGVRGAP